jgi:hypothetical protein
MFTKGITAIEGIPAEPHDGAYLARLPISQAPATIAKTATAATTAIRAFLLLGT